MGIVDLIEGAAGALAADKALEAVDPNAGLIAKTVAAVAGFKGVEAMKDHLENSDEANVNTQPVENT